MSTMSLYVDIKNIIYEINELSTCLCYNKVQILNPANQISAISLFKKNAYI